MSINSSQIVRNHNRGNGKRTVHEEHTDHLGQIHEHRYHCPLDHDVNTALISWQSKLEAILADNEKQAIHDAIIKGVDPAAVSIKHITNLQKAKQVLKALMFGEAKKVIKAAEFVSSFTNAQIENHFTVAQRIRIRTRQNYVLTNQTIIEQDLREEI